VRLVKPKQYNSGQNAVIEKEPVVSKITFTEWKFTNRPRPNKKDILVISGFGEFGCETIGVMYSIPAIMAENPDKYIIIMGWYGRAYLYRHLADEFWEIGEEFQWLREYARAFYHTSKNLQLLEEQASRYGKVVFSRDLARYVVGNTCKDCGGVWGGELGDKLKCRYCKSENVETSVFSNIAKWKKRAVKIPEPSAEKMQAALKYVPENNMVGVFARGRVCYGRNLQPEFYKGLVHLLRDMGYEPIWLGEKQTTQPCPVEDVLDFSRMSESRDMELTVAIISRLKFTVQFWTASTRLSSIVETPYLLFESPDQIFGRGQEGYRRELFDFGKRKLAVCHFLNVFNDNKAGLGLTRRCIEEMAAGNYEDVFALLEVEEVAKHLKNSNKLLQYR
jgi:predicted Zn-ribbon and HTH transcriptional regulator